MTNNTEATWELLKAILPVIELVAGALLVATCLWRGRSGIGTPFALSKSEKTWSISTNGWVLTIIGGLALMALPWYHIREHTDTENIDLKEKMEKLRAVDIQQMESMFSRLTAMNSAHLDIVFPSPFKPEPDDHPPEVYVVNSSSSIHFPCSNLTYTPQGFKVIALLPASDEDVWLTVTWRDQVFGSDIFKIHDVPVKLQPKGPVEKPVNGQIKGLRNRS